MPQFMDVHEGMKGITSDQLRDAHRADLAIEGDEKVHFIKAWADPETGKAFCLSEGPNKEAVQRIHERAGHKADAIYELKVTAE